MAPDFTWMVIAPGGVTNLPLACEAARTGAWGFVDLEDVRDAEGLRDAFSELRSYADVPLGVKLDASRREIWEPLLAAQPPSVIRVILARPPRTAPELRAMVSGLRRLEQEVLVEAVSVDEAVAAHQAGADGIIAKGSEAGGRIGDETSFLLLQRLYGLFPTPVYAQGGVGLHTAAACHVAGARGAVLDWQLCLVEESRIPAPLRLALSRLDGSETFAVGLRLGDAYRLYLGPARTLLTNLQEQEHRLAISDLTEEERIVRWRGVIDETLSSSSGEARKLGMEVSFAARLAAKFRTVGGVLEEMDRSLRFHLSRARETEPLGPGKGVAKTLGTRYPIVQGPMSRVSDTPAFAASVAAAGGLPVMAIAAMREDELEPMLRETSERLGGAPWAAGLLGFLAPELYGPQVELLKKYPPPAVVIAGGQPGQARPFEALGIPTFIHVPSHRLLDLYLDEGTRNVIFEGLESGGHIGRYSGFVLWENVIDVLLARSLRDSKAGRCGALFAGGISTALSGAMVSAIVAPLADRSVDVGVLVGTGYLFTREAVECGAINSGFQDAILAARRTAILDCGGGYQIRAAPNPFCRAFEEEKQRLTAQGLPPEKVRMDLEHLVLGRLRIAAKGLRFNEKRRRDPSQPLTLEVPEPEQRRDGVYMAGHAIVLHDSVYSVEDLHRRISEESNELLRPRPEGQVRMKAVHEGRGDEIAIIGMSAIFPGAPDLDTYWENILAGKYSITEVPPERWNVSTYFHSDPSTRDKIYSRWGGFLDPIEFDPLKYGMPPKALSAIDPSQLLALELVDRAIRDAGYDQREFDREHTSVFVGEGGAIGNMGQLYCFRALLPMFLEKVPEELLAQLPEWTEDSLPGLLPNVIAGRVANQLDLGGTNQSTSAACASALAALSLGMEELRNGKSRMSIVASVDVQQNPFTYLSFSKTMALSPTGTPRCFDASGDGIVLGQGVGVVVLKRLEDAERDGDRIYAVLRGVGSSSDGRGKSLTAPTQRGQLRAIRRAYEQAGLGMDTVELIEAHGTGTVLGDRTEAESTIRALRDAGAAPRSCAVGTVKSMIGHTKGSAGMAGLIKATLALHHKVLPPTLWVKKPTGAELWAGDSPAYLNADVRPWVGREHPRRAGVSSFGFGGTNFHAVVEEHRPELELPRFPTAQLPAELFCFRGPTVERLREDIDEIRRAAAEPAALRELAHRAFRMGHDRQHPGAAFSLSIVADSVDDLRGKLVRAHSALGSGTGPLRDPTGIYFDPVGLGRKGKIAFVFPGQGSQRVDMLRDVTLLFDEVRESFALADRTLASRLPQPLSHYVYPPASFTEEDQAASVEALTRTDITQPALGAAGFGLYKTLRAFGIRPDMAGGHSVGEYVALASAGVFGEERLYELLWTRGACMLRAAGEDSGTMMAIRGARQTVEKLVRDEKAIYVANFNAPLQTVVSGRREGLLALQAKLAAREIEAQLLPVGCGFHSRFVEKAAKEFEKALASVACAPAAWPVYSNYLAATFPEGDVEVRRVLSAHLSHPVRFMEEIERMYEDGARVFLEVGPGKVCGNLIGEILNGKPHVAVSCDGAPSRLGTVRFLHALGQLHAHGVEMRLDPLFNRRTMPSSDTVDVPGIPAAAPRPKVPWMVSPEKSWPVGSPRPPLGALHMLSALPTATVPNPVASADNGGIPDRSPVPAPTVARPAPRSPAMPVSKPAAPLSPPAHGDDGPLGEVIQRHHQLMAAFLEQQKQVMLTYLETRQASGTVRLTTPLQPGGVEVTSPVVAAPLATVPTAPAGVGPTRESPSAPDVVVAPGLPRQDFLQQLVALVAERTGYPAEMLTAEKDMEADLGIDSIKRVEILTSFARQFPNLGAEVPERLRAARTLQDVVQVMRESMAGGDLPTPAVPSEPRADRSAAAPTLPRQDFLQQLVALVAERTGYPAEMLTAEKDMEADLGIDSIKRVEILTSFARQFPNLGAEVPERLRAARTLQDVVQVMRENMAGGISPTPPVTTAPGTNRPASGPALPRQDFLQQLVALVAERTGYPAEMLTAEKDMEADLGIDSIKRVEILTSFARQFPNLGAEVPERLRAARTLQDVVQVMRESMAGGPLVTTADPMLVSEPAGSNDSLDRYVMVMKESVLAEGAAVRIPEGALLITDDGRGFATGLRERLRSLGGRPVIVRPEGPEVAEDQIYVADLADAAQVAALVDRIRRDHGRIGGVVHLLPLRPVPPVERLSAATFERLVDQEVKGLFYLLRSASSDLKSAAGSWAYTCLSFGAPPLDGTLPVPDHPWRGALIGVIKTVAVEWPGVVAKSLALEGPPSDVSVGRILAELTGPANELEAYYRGESRVVPVSRKVTLQAVPASVHLAPEDVIVIIGGARGITSEVACELAGQARPTLILVGRSPWPEAESEVTAGAATDRDLRRVLFSHLTAQGKQPSPMEVDAAARRILREREMRAARSSMEAAGSRVRYYQADIRDGASTKELFRQVYESHGRIDGVVCGAGIIEDKLIEDKTPESFARVFDTKARSIFHLAQCLRPEALKFFVIFSSMAGWTGNRGQVDYVAGNEVLNRMAVHLNARWNRRVVAIDWGPWDKDGMVTAEIRRQFIERGVGLVSPDAGRRFLLDEIRFGNPTDTIVGVMGRLEVEQPSGRAAQYPVPASGTLVTVGGALN